MIVFNTRYTTRIDYVNFKVTIFMFYIYYEKQSVQGLIVQIRGISHLIVDT